MRIKQKRFLRNSDTPSVYHGSVCQSRIFSLAAAFVDLWAIDLESGFKLVATAMTSASYRPTPPAARAARLRPLYTPMRRRLTCAANTLVNPASAADVGSATSVIVRLLALATRVPW